MQQEHSEKHGVKQWLMGSSKVAVCLMVAVAIFGLGVGVGKGNITLSRGNSEHKNLPDHLNYASIDQLYQVIKANYDGPLDQTKLLDGIKSGLAEATGDPYTEYFNADQAKDFSNELNGTFSGVGAELGKDASNNLIVISPIDGFPAAKAGLRPQDIIVAIDGKSTAGLSIDEAITRIRGPKGTQVTLKIVRHKSDALSFTITRDDIRIPSVKAEVLDNNIGYMQITQFASDTAQLAMGAAQKFKDAGVKGVILDLRGNPGGAVDAAVGVSSLWLPEGSTVLQEKTDAKVLDTEVANGNDMLRGMPTVVLVDAGSASASEITAAALHDNKVATIIGEKTYGKGVVQRIEPLPNGAELKVTIARWYRPNGQNIDKKGISPDSEVKITEDDLKNKLDPQKDAALQFLKPH